MRATIKDVARAANVSPSTVSLVMNKRPASISAETRARVQKAAAELRYRPNQLAAGLVTKKTHTLGLIVPDICNYFHAAFCEQIERNAEARGYSILIRIAQNDPQKTIRYLLDFDDRGIDGVILTSSMFESPEDTSACLQAISDMRIPVMLTDRVPPERQQEAILPNDYLGGYLAATHLLELGHKRIGYVTGRLYLLNCLERLRGCRAALEEHGIEFDSSLVYEGDFQFASGYEALSYLLGKQVTAIFCFNDNIAYGVYRQMRNYNLNIPNDLSLIGFDDLSFSDLTEPPLTTLEYPVAEMAQTVVEQLLDKIEGRVNEDTQWVFNPVLKVKGSTRRLVEQ